MRILLVGAGGVGGAIALIAARRDFVERAGRRPTTTSPAPRRRSPPPATRGSSPPGSTRPTSAAVAALLAEHRCDALLNATDPRFVMPLFRAALAAGVALPRHGHVAVPAAPERPYEETGRQAR